MNRAPLVLAAALLAACGNGTTGPLVNPGQATEKAPDDYRVKFETTQGSFAVVCHRAWAPNGADRFYNLVKIGFFDDVAFFRVVRKPSPFVVQFGIHGNPDVSAAWASANIPRDPPTQSNTRGMLTFAMAESPDTRSTQLFVNYGNNTSLDKMGFAPLCKVEGDGMIVVDKFYDGYGEGPTAEQGEIMSGGNKFLKERHPLLDYIKTARIEAAPPADSASASATTATSAPPAPSETAAPTASAAASSSAAPSASTASSAAPSASAKAAASAAPSAKPTKK